MNKANKNANNAKNPVDMLDAKVVGGAGVPEVVNSSEKTSVAIPKIGS